LPSLGYEPQRLQFITGNHGTEQLTNVLKALKPRSEILPTFFVDLTEKRALMQRAVKHLYEQAGSPPSLVALPGGAPFGGIDIDPRRCTLCMACATVCPVAAVFGSDTGDQLRFFEEECVQCGLCRQSCPEQAISLVPRLRYQVQTHGNVLHEEEPFKCICCGVPFSTRKMVDRLTEKLTDHWMFQDDRARRRLQMCKQCRLQDIFARQENIQVHR
jgi:ferredoxin